MGSIPDEQFAAAWRAARSAGEMAVWLGTQLNRAIPRWAAVARAVTLRERGVELPPLSGEEPPTRVRRGESTAFANVRELAARLMAEHNLTAWEFGFNRNVRRAGVCRYPGRRTAGRIELSRHFVERNSVEEVRDTILHEIAHALVGPQHGHDAVWKAKCKEIGAKPERCYDERVEMPKGRWRATCPCCQKEFDRHRRPKSMTGWSCKACGKDRGTLTWVPVG
jgi:predicted SprT family Zn-dependent metalloprotease